MRKRLSLPAAFLLILLVWPLSAQAPRRKTVFLTYEEAQQVVTTLDEILPPEFKGKSPSEQAAAWPGWVKNRDAEIRARLSQGDEDSLVNLMLFGTSFTKQPRVSPQQVAELGRAMSTTPEGARRQEASQLLRVLQPRADDFVKALAAPGREERLLFARQFLAGRKGSDPGDPARRADVKASMLAALSRVLNEQAGYVRTLEAARSR